MKRILTLLLVAALMLGMALPALAAGVDVGYTSLERSMGYSLKALGLMKGVSDTNMDLSGALTRQQSLVMLIRLLGRESEAAVPGGGSHPFADVDSWASGYVAYAYANGLVKGVSATKLDASGRIAANTFLTLVLRALGYSDAPGGDFTWDEPYNLAAHAGILPTGVDRSDFRRGDAVAVSYAALGAYMKDGRETLAQRLIAAGVFTAEDFARFYDAKALASGAMSEAVIQALEPIARTADVDDGLNISGLGRRWHNSVVQIGDAGYELYGFYEYGARSCATRVKEAAEALSGRARVFYLIAPNSIGGVISTDSAAEIVSASEGKGIAYSYGCAGDKVTCVDAYTALRMHNSEYIYLRTDHHWSALGAYYAYAEWAKDAGFTPTPLTDFDTLDMPGHLGLFYSLSGNPAEMRANPDTVTAYIPRGDISVKITNNSKTWDGKLVNDYTGNGVSYKYNAFLGGDFAMTVITNNDVEGDSSCVLIKDSYGNPFAVYLAQHYKTVYVLDYRTYCKQSGYKTLSAMEEVYDIDDVIILLSMTLSQSDGSSSLLKSYCK